MGYVFIGKQDDDNTGVDGGSVAGTRVHDLGGTHQPERPDERNPRVKG